MTPGDIPGAGVLEPRRVELFDRWSLTGRPARQIAGRPVPWEGPRLPVTGQASEFGSLLPRPRAQSVEETLEYQQWT